MIYVKPKNTYKPSIYFRDDEMYFVFHIRKYYHFDSISVVSAKYEPCYMGSVYAPILQSLVQLTPTVVEPKTIALQHMFSVSSHKCKNGIDNYIKDNLNRYIESSIWDDSDKEVIDKYVTDINRKYNIDLDVNSVKFTNQYCWEVI